MSPEFEIRHELISDLMHHLDRKGALGLCECDKEKKAFIEGLKMPMTLKRMFQWSWPSKWADLPPYRLAPLNEVFSGDCFPRFFAAGMLILGAAKNGDCLVLRIYPDRHEMGLLNTTQFAGEDSDTSPELFYTRVCGSLDELLFRMTEERFLPIDYWSAVELNQLKHEIGEDGADDASKRIGFIGSSSDDLKQAPKS
ncbi:hypothetical protein [Prosthecobacter sp.]|uniref:hypothetical protein n=1 Tax=Prosthecobacter sp. TaxID=1965333 RepID=UPI0037844F04